MPPRSSIAPAGVVMLGLHKSTLFRKIKALGMELPEEDGRSGRGGKESGTDKTDRTRDCGVAKEKVEGWA